MGTNSKVETIAAPEPPLGLDRGGNQVSDAAERDHRGRFVPGVSGNLCGRPKGTSLGKLVEQILDEDYESEGGMTRREALARALISQATEGRGNAAKELLARVWPAEKAIAVRASAERDPVRVKPQQTMEEMIETLRIIEEVHLASQLPSGEGTPHDQLEPLADVAGDGE